MSDISYIITVYNKEKCLPLLIASLENQSGNFDREYIFVNDGSTDNSLLVLKELCANLPNSSIVSQENKGPSSAINLGLTYATKKWVYLVDGDDYLLPHASQLLLDLANNYNVKMCHARHTNNPKKESRVFDDKIIIYEDGLYKAIDFYPIGASTAIIDRELMLSVGGCDERIFVQDYSISLRIAQYTSFLSVNTLVSYNIEQNQSRLSSNKLQENHDTAAARAFYMLDNIQIDYPYKYIGIKKQLRKAWSWYRKQQFIKSIFSKHFVRYIISRFDLSYSDYTIQKWLSESLEVYDESLVRKGYLLKELHDA